MPEKIKDIDHTVGSVRIEINMGRTNRNLADAQTYLNQRIIQDSTPFVPHREGPLRNSVWCPEGLIGDVVEWDTPYAHYQYVGELYLTENGSPYASKGEKKYPSGIPLTYSEPGTGPEWFEEAKQQYGDEWIKGVKEIMKDG